MAQSPIAAIWARIVVYKCAKTVLYFLVESTAVRAGSLYIFAYFIILTTNF